MRTPRLLVLVVSCLVVISPARAQQFVAPVIGIADGDTITVLHMGQPEKLRLADIDCPEKNQPFGTAAKKYTADLTFRNTVTVETSGKDRFKRTIARVTLPDGRSLNRELVRAGYAWCYRKYSKDPDLPALEADARANRRGLWSAPNPIPPWEYRKNKRSSAIGDTTTNSR